MKKLQLSQKTQANIMNATAIVAGLMLGCVICLFLLLMTYNKRTVRVAGTDYVREVTKWPGHTHISNIPVEYELYIHTQMDDMDVFHNILNKR